MGKSVGLGHRFQQNFIGGKIDGFEPPKKLRKSEPKRNAKVA
jgi:hypothetical protein